MSPNRPPEGDRTAVRNTKLPPCATPSCEVEAAPRSPVERLNQSRAQLRVAAMRIVDPPRRARPFGRGAVGAVVNPLVTKLRAWPAVALVIGGAERWWHQHPLRAVLSLAAPLATTEMKRRPKTLLVAAFAAGAALRLLKPWRLLLRPALVVGLMSQVARHAFDARRAP